jgi:TolB protein
MMILLIHCDKSPNESDSGPNRQILDLSQFENQYEIVFGLNQEIFSIHSDGSNLIQLTHNDYYDHTPFWTNAGDEIIFTSNRETEEMNIYKMSSDGTDRVKLTYNNCFNSNISISPIGDYFAYTEGCYDIESSTSSLFCINYDGSNLIKLADTSPNDAVWSFDGQKLLFSESNLLYIVSKNGEPILTLTDSSTNVHHPKWCPDQEKIVFVSHPDNSEICIIDGNGENEVNLTNHAAWDNLPIVSPDGSKIIFLSDRDGDMDLYIMNIDGSDVRNLTQDTFDWNWYHPVWSPDGSRIAYNIDPNEDKTVDNICIMDIETGYYQILTTGGAVPQWSPNPVIK